MACIHTVQQGEYLSSIAQQYGFSDWHVIYNHPKNADFKNNRPDPNIIEPGDEIYIPDKDLKQESGPTEQHHKFQVAVPKAWLGIIVKDAGGNPIASQAYTLTIAGRKITGTTDGSGMLQQPIPIGVTEGTLSLDGLGVFWKLRIGHLDPVDGSDDDEGIAGIQARLNNLAFYCGEVDGILGPRTRSALANFQRLFLSRQNPNGIPDAATRQALASQHGC